MHYISIPVHEKPDVIADQLLNFQKYFPSAMVVLHLSRDSRLVGDDLAKTLSAAGVRNVLLNPKSVSTAWGSILPAHLCNIRFIRELGDATTILFHSSNDMLVRAGVDGYVADACHHFNLRPLRPGSNWWVAEVAIRDTALRQGLARLGSISVFGSQIEGSAYDARTLFEISDLIERWGMLDTDLFYPREEIFLPSMAHALGLRPTGLPYIFSEVHYFDRVLWAAREKYRFFVGRQTKWSRALNEKLNKKLFKSKFYAITTVDVENVARGRSSSLKNAPTMSDGNNEWRIYDPKHLYGVKRIERKYDDPIRAYIRSL